MRLLGNRTGLDQLAKTPDRMVVDRTAEIRDDALAVGRLSERVPVLVFINNHYAGFAHSAAREMWEAMRT